MVVVDGCSSFSGNDDFLEDVDLCSGSIRAIVSRSTDVLTLA